ncbi:hypothetical protein BAB75_14515 [Mycobacteroides immunogenum]|nr:hypothetical protein BAB75_14515 [Mycobacteroides immunogenum]
MFCCGDPDVSVRGALPQCGAPDAGVSRSNVTTTASNDVLALVDPYPG